jgi:hypothetical protein
MTVQQVVGDRARARPREVAGEAHVRREKQNGKECPRVVEPREEENRQNECDQALNAQPVADGTTHGTRDLDGLLVHDLSERQPPHSPQWTFAPAAGSVRTFALPVFRMPPPSSTPTAPTSGFTSMIQNGVCA